MSRSWWVIWTCLVVVIAPRAAGAFGRCTDADYMASFFSGLGAQANDCDVIDNTMQIHWSGHMAKVRLVKLHGSPYDPALGNRELVQQLTDKVGTALGQMGNVSLEQVTIMLRDVVASDPGVAAHAWGRPGECTITFWKQASGHTPDVIEAVLAHELFHCVQRATWHGDTNNRGWWWAEGTATYFAYLAIPGTTVGDEVIGAFDSGIATTSLVRFAYPAVVFFLWLGETQGPEAITRLILAMPDNSSSDAQLDGLRSQVSADQWLAFAQAYLDRGIHMPGGRGLPSSPVLGAAQTITDGAHLAMPAAPYTIQNRELVFPARKLFDASFEHQPSDARVSWRKASGGTWRAPPTTVSTCDGEDRERMVWLTTTSPAAGEVTFREEPGDVCSCPAGTWVETSDSLHHFFEQSNVGDTPRFLAGTRRLTLHSDHTGSFSYESVEVETPPSHGVFSHSTLDGTVHFSWKLAGGMLLTVLDRGQRQTLKNHSELHTPGGMNVQDHVVPAQSIGHQFRCSGTQLFLTEQPRVTLLNVPARYKTGRSVDMTFDRVAAPPAQHGKN